MLQEEKNLIIKNFKSLVQRCDLNSLIIKLEENGVSSDILRVNPHYTNNQMHNKRCLLFTLMKFDVFHKLVQSLRDLGMFDLSDRLNLNVKKSAGCVAFRIPKVKHNNDIILSNNNAIDILNAAHLASNEILKINVIPSKEFRDTDEYNATRYYRTRSKNRGVVLVINNYEFSSKDNPRRYGAEVDSKNIKELFEEMNFKVIIHTNLSMEQMKQTIRDFASFSQEKISDICFVIVLSHGKQDNNQTVIYGTDDFAIDTNWIIRQFSNESCPLFSGKPKIFLFQTCRGEELDEFAGRTQSDSINKPLCNRSFSDILIVYPTVKGFKAHRDSIRGSWLIDVLCEIFMKHAHELHVECMLKKVDEKFSYRISELKSMQTLNFENIGFQNCYLHPGIYEENGQIFKFKQ